MNVVIRPGSYDDMIEVLTCSQYRNHPEGKKIIRDWFMKSSQVWVGLKDDQIVCGWGLIQPTFLSTRAYIWLLTHEEMGPYKFCFVRQSKIWIEKMLETHMSLWGICMSTNDRGIKWLTWLGAKFERMDDDRLEFQIRRG